MITEDRCCSTVLQSLSPKFGMRSDVQCWIAKLKFALNKGSSWKNTFTSKFLVPAKPLVFLLLLIQLMVFCIKVLEASTLPLTFIEKAAIWICMAEKNISCSQLSKSPALLNIWSSENTYENWFIDSYPHISMSFFGGRKRARATYRKFMMPWSLTTSLCLVTSVKLESFCSVFGNAFYLLIKQWLYNNCRKAVVAWDVSVPSSLFFIAGVS